MNDPLREISAPALWPQGPSRVRPIFFSLHVGALVLDGIVLVGVLAVTGLFFGLLREAVRPMPAALDEFACLSVLVLFTIGEVAFGASPGKSMLGYVIRTPTGERAPARRLAVRWAVKHAPLVLLVIANGLRLAVPWGASARGSPVSWLATVLETAAGLAVVGLLLGGLLALGPARLTLHDRIAGTAVIDATRLPVDIDPPRRGFEVAPVPAIPVEQGSSDPSSAAPPSDQIA
jgi:hypothetical protein